MVTKSEVNDLAFNLAPNRIFSSGSARRTASPFSHKQCNITGTVRNFEV